MGASLPRFELLIVEDDEADVMLTRRTLRRAGVDASVSVARDGEDALARLRRQPPYEDARRPTLILLDLNMPRMDGHEFLKQMKADEHLRSIPVVVLTTSRGETDVLRSYDLQAASFISKPTVAEEFTRLGQTLKAYWIRLVELPGATAP